MASNRWQPAETGPKDFYQRLIFHNESDAGKGQKINFILENGYSDRRESKLKS
jgi:hypothetical protein